ncbi:MAG: transcriptional regulator [Acidobacteria bacterium]|nr:MAG: transcriptional regulator [Acidobacteriota bacterium]
MTRIPFFDLKRQFRSLRTVILEEIAEVCDSQSFILGPKVEMLEKSISALCNDYQAIGMSSGTDAELALLMGFGVGPGDAVVTSPFTFFATAGCVARLGARPIFVDIDLNTFNLLPARLEEFFNSRCCFDRNGLRTREGQAIKAVIPVHLFGLCCEMDQILSICSHFRVPVIEDGAQAIGAEYPSGNGPKRAGAMGAAGFFSFYPTKNLGAFGDAGVALTKDLSLAEHLRVLRNHGMEPKYRHDFVGGNFRLDAMQAAILLKKLPHLRRWSWRRWEIAQYYRRKFRDFAPALHLPTEPFAQRLGDRGHTYHQFVVRTDQRDGLRDHLKSCGIGTEVYYPVPLHRQKCFGQANDFSCPNAELAANQVLALPIFPELTDDEVEIVAEAVVSFFKK